jgi:hypothetical protein
MKAYIIMFNRLTWPLRLCQDLTKAGLEVILVDNGSTYPPLLNWYKTKPYEIHYTTVNGALLGSKSPWLSGIIDKHSDPYYLVTDHDLDISRLPSNWVDVLMNGFNAADCTKSGLSLKLDDLPGTEYANQVIAYEKGFSKTIVNGYYSAPIDTTLAIYSREKMKAVKFPFDLIDGSESIFYNAVRSMKPYEARHLPWYNTPETLSIEEQYYLKHIGNDGYWSRKFLEVNGLDTISI